jgi:methylated-DNA-[protein]-cysteine S-methyltransferase
LQEVLRYASVETPIGRLYFAYDRDGIVLAKLAEDDSHFIEHCLEEYQTLVEPDPSPPAALLRVVQSRLGANVEVPLHLERFTSFQRAVLRAVSNIPYGEVRTYEQIAESVGHPRAARAVGEVMRTNRIPVLIPCHRVVRSGGDVGRYSPDPSLKLKILLAEGVPLDDLTPRRSSRRRSSRLSVG